MASTPVAERPLTAAGVRSRVLEAGPAEATEAVVFIHGNPNSADEWRDLMGRTAAFARSVALDMPGFGRADRPRTFDVPVRGYAEFLADALGQLGIARAHLVLHDFGGPWGLAWAVSAPDSFASAVLVNTGLLFGFEVHAIGRKWAKRGVGELVMALTTRARFHAALRESNPNLSEAFVDEMYDGYDRGTRRMVLRLYRNRTNDETLGLAAGALAQLDRPALVLWGTADTLVPLRHAEQQTRAFPRARIELLDGLGHWPFVEQPDRVAELVVPFLREQVAGAGSPSPTPG
jgi:pimeloyl-ACP methyl ester carboxylesterase